MSAFRKQIGGDRAGGPDGPEPLRVSAKGAHPLRDLWDDEICALVDAAFETVSRNPSDHETAIAYRTAIAWALDRGAA